MLFYRYKATPTAAAGTFSVKLSDGLPIKYSQIQPRQIQFTPMIMRQCLIRSASALTTFNATLYDFEGLPIRKWTGATQVINDLTETPIMGDVTLTVDTSSADEAYAVLLIVADER